MIGSATERKKNSISRGETHSDTPEWPHSGAQHNSIFEQVINYQLLRADRHPLKPSMHTEEEE